MLFIFLCNIYLLACGQYYKLNTEPAVAALEKDSLMQKAVVNELVTSFVAMKAISG